MDNMEGFDLTGIVDDDLLVYNAATTNFEPAASTTLAINASQVSGLSEAAQDATASLIQNGTGISWSYNDPANTLTPTVSLAPFSTTNLAEGTNLYYTAARFDTAFAAKTTTDLSEGSNLYFTDERAQDAVGTALTDSSSVDFTYTDGSNQITAVVLPAGVDHNSLQNYVADRHVAHTGVTLTAGAGLTGGGDISANRTFAVGAGTGITVNADDVAVTLSATFAWSNQHTYSLAGSLATPTILMTSTQPVLAFDETDQGSDEKRWAIAPVAKAFQIRSATDSGGASIIWFSALRGTGTAIASITIGDSTNNNTYSFSSTGLATFAGSVSAGTFIPASGAAPTNGLYLPGTNNPAISANSTKVLDCISTAARVTGNLSLTTAGNKLLIKEGTNAAMGASTLVGGTVTVNNTLVSASSRIFLTVQSLGTVAAPKAVAVTARTAGTSFTITSADATDTSVVAWHIVEPA